MLPPRPIISSLLLIILMIGGLSAVVSPVGAHGAWQDGVLDGEPGDVAIIATHAAESPAEVSSSSGGATARGRTNTPSDEAIGALGFATPSSLPPARLHLLHCVFII